MFIYAISCASKLMNLRVVNISTLHTRLVKETLKPVKLSTNIDKVTMKPYICYSNTAKTMTALEYNILGFFEKHQLLKDYGLLLDEKIQGNQKIRVYSMGDFFVEEGLQFDNEPRYFRALESLMESEHYLDPLHTFYLN